MSGLFALRKRTCIARGLLICAPLNARQRRVVSSAAPSGGLKRYRRVTTGVTVIINHLHHATELLRDATASVTCHKNFKKTKIKLK
jgi:hypothetical protein